MSDPFTDGLSAGLKPQERMDLSEWAEARMVIPAERASAPGPYRVGDAIYQRAAHPFAQKQDLGIGDLLECGWILAGSGSLARGRLDSMLLERGFAYPKNVVETSALPVTISLLQITDMITMLPEKTIRIGFRGSR